MKHLPFKRDVSLAPSVFTYDVGEVIQEFWPVITTIFDSSDFGYDCYCFIDNDGDQSRNSGDFEGSATNVSTDDTAISITMSQIP